MAQNVTSVTILDHHKTAQADLENWEDRPGKIIVHFDMNRCGSRIAYDHFDGESLHISRTLINYIQDRDLWNWTLTNSKQVSAWISTFGEGLDSFAALLDEYEHLGLEGVIIAGDAVIGYQKQVVDKHLKSVEVYNLLGHKVAVVNATTMISEVCHEALNKYPEADFALSWQDLVKEKKRVFSLRGRKGGVDVSEVAKKLGGGGHASAAGFSVEMPWLDIGAGY
jgi:oligoribonuclease NrnB/cAMP/cGMP phosphodiesterase (DHH superfamily)